MLFKIRANLNREGKENYKAELFIEAPDEETALEQAHQELFLSVPFLFDEYREDIFTFEVIDCPNEGCYCGSCFCN